MRSQEQFEKCRWLFSCANHNRFVYKSVGETSNFTCAESEANEQNLLLSLISVRFHTCEVRRLTRDKLITNYQRPRATKNS